MGGRTNRVKIELECEKNFTPREALEYLQTRENFRFVSESIRELLLQRGIVGDDSKLSKAFVKLMREKGVASVRADNMKNWFYDKVFPGNEYSIKMCFAFELSSRTAPTATEFLWNTCRVNGFNFRRADEVIFYYALERSKTYSYAVDLFNRYVESTADYNFETGSETKSTAELWNKFGKPDIMSEDELFDVLCENEKNFIEYRKTVHTKFVEICDNLVGLIKEDIKESQTNDKAGLIPEYDNKFASIYSEIIFDDTVRSISSIKGSKGERRSVLTDISVNFPINEYIGRLYRSAKYENPKAINADYYKEHGFARKLFILCFFSEYVIKWEHYLSNLKPKWAQPKRFYADFYKRLNSLLNKCSYAPLYPRNPFDWLILNCIRSLDSLDENSDALGLFNETLSMLIKAQEN